MTDLSVRPLHGYQSPVVLSGTVAALQVADIPVAITLEPAECQSDIEGRNPGVEAAFRSKEANDRTQNNH